MEVLLFYCERNLSMGRTMSVLIADVDDLLSLLSFSFLRTSVPLSSCLKSTSEASFCNLFFYLVLIQLQVVAIY